MQKSTSRRTQLPELGKALWVSSKSLSQAPERQTEAKGGNRAVMHEQSQHAAGLGIVDNPIH